MCWLEWRFIVCFFCASSKGSGESTHLHRLTLAFVTVPKSHALPQMAIRVLFTPAGRLMSLHICTGIVTGQWRVYTFAQAYLSLRHCTKISCAASDGDFCSIHPKRRLVSLHICAGVVTGQWNKYQNLMCWQRRLWRVCTFALARLSLAKVTQYNVLVPMAICVLFM